MRYSQIRSMDISNGEGLGASLFVQGCPHRCTNCFNPETWDFNGGKEWTEETEKEFLKLIDRPYIKRVSILGGSPLAKQNLDGVLKLVNQIRLLFPEKTIWLYTGYTWEQLFEDDKFDIDGGICENQIRRAIILSVDILVDGRFEEDKKDLSLEFRGSSNQRIIDIQQSLNKGELILWHRKHTN